LWESLHAIVPGRGLPGLVELSTGGLLINATFPPVEGYALLDDARILTTFEELQNATRGIRDLRNNCLIPPKQRVTATVVVPEAHLEAFKSHAHIVRHMAGIGELNITAAAKRPPNAASVTIQGLRIFVHDATDDRAERDRTRKAIEALEKQIAGKQTKLGNPQFITNANPDVVEAERGRLNELVAQQTSLRDHLAELGLDG
jgi:valyl-tRNA synthetase